MLVWRLYEVLRYIAFPILLLSLVSYIHNLPCALFFEVPSEFVVLTNQSKYHTLQKKKTSQIIVLRNSSHIWFRLGSKTLNQQNAFAGFICDFHTYYIHTVDPTNLQQ